MGYETSQYVISDHLLRASYAQSRRSAGKNIGEAKITHTIFGRAKIRVIHEQDKKRRVWLLLALMVVALTAAAWQGWFAILQGEQLLGDDSTVSSGVRVQVSEPAYQPEFRDPTSISQQVNRKTKSIVQYEIDSLVTRKREAPPPAVTIVSKQVTAKPDTSKVSITAKPDTPKVTIAAKPLATPSATNNNSSANQAGNSQLLKPPAAIQAASTNVLTPAASQPVATQPATVASPVVTEVKEIASTPSTAGDGQIPVPVKVQP